MTNVWHSLETLQKSLAEATREIANSHIAVAKLSETVSRQERQSRAFNIRVLGVREENGENCINLLERIISERFDIPAGTTTENAHRTGKPVSRFECVSGLSLKPAAVVEWLALRTPNHVDAAASGRSRVQSPAGAL